MIAEVETELLSEEEKTIRRRESQKRYYYKDEDRTTRKSTQWQRMFIGNYPFKKLCKIFKIRYEDRKRKG